MTSLVHPDELRSRKEDLLAEQQRLREQVHATVIRGQQITNEIAAIDFQLTFLARVADTLTGADEIDPFMPCA